NRSDLISLDSELDKTRTRHRILFFEGKHEWAPGATMRTAFIGWQLDAMEEKLLPRDEAFIRDWIAKSKGRVEVFIRDGRFIKARQECRVPETTGTGRALACDGAEYESGVYAAFPAARHGVLEKNDRRASGKSRGQDGGWRDESAAAGLFIPGLLLH